MIVSFIMVSRDGDFDQPASTLVYVAALATPESRVEIDASACRA